MGMAVDCIHIYTGGSVFSLIGHVRLVHVCIHIHLRTYILPGVSDFCLTGRVDHVHTCMYVCMYCVCLYIYIHTYIHITRRKRLLSHWTCRSCAFCTGKAATQTMCVFMYVCVCVCEYTILTVCVYVHMYVCV
jgi:hypothetical protein